jgi:homoprotocatechuate degradation regulator HpaR
MNQPASFTALMSAKTSTETDDAAGATEKLRDFSLSLPMALLRAREAVMARFRPLLRAHDITEQQWRVLRALTASPEPLKPSEISRMTFLSLPSLSRLLRTLEARGLMVRSAHGADLRAAQLALSPAGRSLVEAIAPVSEARYAEMGEAIGADDMASLYALLEKVAQRLGTPDAVAVEGE